MSELIQIISQFYVLFDESRYSQVHMNFKSSYSPLWEVFSPPNSNNSNLADNLNRSDFSQSVVLYPDGSQKYPRLFTAALFWGMFDVSPQKYHSLPWSARQEVPPTDQWGTRWDHRRTSLANLTVSHRFPVTFSSSSFHGFMLTVCFSVVFINIALNQLRNNWAITLAVIINNNLDTLKAFKPLKRC